jgi:hypothetical protein
VRTATVALRTTTVALRTATVALRTATVALRTVTIARTAILALAAATIRAAISWAVSVSPVIVDPIVARMVGTRSVAGGPVVVVVHRTSVVVVARAPVDTHRGSNVRGM